ncbi:MAG: hypothetical protein A2664_04735 [Candidatus Taylorbacteria bacterium RIFCSPHIGHO2_01_FULL_46_22b]|uniref:bAvd-like domain-containing protein n=1 Tax=Candidatus Taylorbacteria bacterium RIFCSPHIGHO2_01_FULL_46_22b TaxID=1802301 RepID=A0A1G2M4F9_9BACT|nr:MAG: hypothetical protein A2664_04735 [Candidatus Taylorbacteria bacterium RIFCSPHIGHO2_01_FULL_46_22b]
MPIIHCISILYKELYATADKFPKQHKLGIHAEILRQSLKILSLAVEAAFKSKFLKLPILEKLRIEIEILKHLVRTENELKIIDTKIYLRLSEQLVEISKMTSGWLKFITQKGV